jgi:hypothetical protein
MPDPQGTRKKVSCASTPNPQQRRQLFVPPVDWTVSGESTAGTWRVYVPHAGFRSSQRRDRTVLRYSGAPTPVYTVLLAVKAVSSKLGG